MSAGTDRSSDGPPASWDQSLEAPSPSSAREPASEPGQWDSQERTDPTGPPVIDGRTTDPDLPGKAVPASVVLPVHPPLAPAAAPAFTVQSVSASTVSGPTLPAPTVPAPTVSAPTVSAPTVSVPPATVPAPVAPASPVEWQPPTFSVQPRAPVPSASAAPEPVRAGPNSTDTLLRIGVIAAAVSIAVLSILLLAWIAASLGR